MQHRPIASVPYLNRGEENCVEIDIVFPHELVKLHILRVEPPLLPFARVVCRDAWVSNRSIKLPIGSVNT